MEDKVQGIVLQSIRYGENDLITKIYTKNLGLQSYMIKGAFKKGSKNRSAFFQNMTIINFEAIPKKSGSSLGFIKDVELSCAFQSIPFEMQKIAIIMYMSELLTKTLTEQEKNPDLFQFINESLIWIDLVDKNYANFPIYFSLELSRFLGFYPKQPIDSSYPIFDLLEGQFERTVPQHPYYLDREDSALFSQFIGLKLDELPTKKLSNQQRRDTLDNVIKYMRLHAPVLKGLQSHEILRTVL